ncbi:hypothetical protein IGI78_000518 [Enterococcus sp. DIV1767]
MENNIIKIQTFDYDSKILLYLIHLVPIPLGNHNANIHLYLLVPH